MWSRLDLVGEKSRHHFPAEPGRRSRKGGTAVEAERYTAGPQPGRASDGAPQLDVALELRAPAPNAAGDRHIEAVGVEVPDRIGGQELHRPHHQPGVVFGDEAAVG